MESLEIYFSYFSRFPSQSFGLLSDQGVLCTACVYTGSLTATLNPIIFPHIPRPTLRTPEQGSIFLVLVVFIIQATQHTFSISKSIAQKI